MKIMVLGGDGYLGWPTAMHLAVNGHEVQVVDNYLKRDIAKYAGAESLITPPMLGHRAMVFASCTGLSIDYHMGDCTQYALLRELIYAFQPDAVVHYAELPSAPYSMLGYHEARATMDNNLHTTLALAHAVMEAAPDCHIIKLGTMGEYGTPNVPINEGWLDHHVDGRDQRFLYPAQPGSLYHVTKVQDTHLLWLYCRTHQLRVTDIMQGPVYGLETSETKLHQDLGTSFHYDDLFGTVLNRFVAQAVVGHPLTVYGAGGQTRGFIHLQDVVRCIQLICTNPPDKGNLRIINQITEVQSVLELAEMVQEAADFPVTIKRVPNPREEAEEHFFEVDASTLRTMGLKPTVMTKELLADMLRTIHGYGAGIKQESILPRHSWRHSPTHIGKD